MPANTLVTSAFALLAFLLAFYALLARERKTPYITTFIYPIASLVTVSIFIASISSLIPASFPRAKTVSEGVAATLLCIALTTVVYNVWRLHNRHVHFRDDHLIRNTSVVRYAKHLLRRLRRKPSYEHTPPKLTEDALRILLSDTNPNDIILAGVRRDFKTVPQHRWATSLSISICQRRLSQTDEFLVAIIADLLDKDCYVQYTTCIRHPFELIDSLASAKVLENQAHARRVAVIDAYTPHFGFTDSVHLERTAEITGKGVIAVTSRPSYAGVHTATARAFNKLKDESGGQVRNPTLVVYEGCSALIDLESPEQYRIFLRHVLPSEHAWGGMVTVFVEPTASDVDSLLLQTYSDIYVGPARIDTTNPVRVEKTGG
jgi:hypothetical protein